MIWDHARAAVGVDLVLLRVHQGALEVLLQPREKAPEFGVASLPGGLFRPPSLPQWQAWEQGAAPEGWDPSLTHAAQRILSTRCGLPEGTWIEQLYTFSALGRDPRGPVLSVAWWTALPPAAQDVAGAWAPVEGLQTLAFDHREIAELARARLKGKLDYAPHLAARFLPPTFTAAELRGVFEAVHGTPQNRGSFGRRLERWDWLETVGQRDTKGRPAQVYATVLTSEGA